MGPSRLLATWLPLPGFSLDQDDDGCGSHKLRHLQLKLWGAAHPTGRVALVAGTDQCCRGAGV